eukprot:jgi/Chrzof1/316/Cz01g11050.t1
MVLDEEAERPPVDIFTSLPPPANVGRKSKVAVLVGSAILEFVLTGGVAWAPLLCAVAYIAFTPSHAEAKQREAALVEQATARAQADLLNKMPVTPLETAGWMNRFNVEMWQPFWQPFLLKNNLTMWQVTSPLRHDPISRASDYLVWQQRKTVPHQVAVRVTAP